MHPRVASVLRTHSIQFQIHRHSTFAAEIRSPEAFANALGYELRRITKSLFVRCKAGSVRAMIVCPVNKRVDLAAVATNLQCKKVEMAAHSELEDEVGYPPTGVSPLGLDGTPVFMDASLFDCPTILIGSGEKGVELELSPSDLREITGASILPLAI
jgi:Cys-tRNA(Pro)/Cys-tRNA(Cys) deacylase